MASVCIWWCETPNHIQHTFEQFSIFICRFYDATWLLLLFFLLFLAQLKNPKTGAQLSTTKQIKRSLFLALSHNEITYMRLPLDNFLSIYHLFYAQIVTMADIRNLYNYYTNVQINAATTVLLYAQCLMNSEVTNKENITKSIFQAISIDSNLILIKLVHFGNLFNLFNLAIKKWATKMKPSTFVYFMFKWLEIKRFFISNGVHWSAFLCMRNATLTNTIQNNGVLKWPQALAFVRF